MIIEKSNTAQLIIEKISATSSKVAFINDSILSQALIYLENNGIPTHKNEDYKYCNFDAILKKDFKNIEQKFIEITEVNSYKLKNTITLVVVNGNYSEALSDKIIPKGLIVNSFTKSDAVSLQLISTVANIQSDPFIAINTAFCGNGFHLKVEKGAIIDLPVHVLYISNSKSESFVNTRNLIELQENTNATIIEQQVIIGTERIFTNYLSEKLIANNAKLYSIFLQNEGLYGYSLNTNVVKLNSQCFYENTTLTLSGEVVRNNHSVILAGQNSQAYLNGLFSAKTNQLIDNHTLMDHQEPNCESSELYKGIVNDKSTAVFNGKIYVRKNAQKTNAYQSSKNILLSDNATVNTKPQLEIYADDVKCSHGTSTGKIDEQAIFYLNTRGIGKEFAKKMLLNSFASEVINKIRVESLKQTVINLIEREL